MNYNFVPEPWYNKKFPLIVQKMKLNVQLIYVHLDKNARIIHF